MGRAKNEKKQNTWQLNQGGERKGKRRQSPAIGHQRAYRETQGHAQVSGTGWLWLSVKSSRVVSRLCQRDYISRRAGRVWVERKCSAEEQSGRFSLRLSLSLTLPLALPFPFALSCVPSPLINVAIINSSAVIIWWLSVRHRHRHRQRRRPSSSWYQCCCTVGGAGWLVGKDTCTDTLGET